MAAIAAVKEIFEAVPHIRKIGAKHLWFDFEIDHQHTQAGVSRVQDGEDKSGECAAA